MILEKLRSWEYYSNKIPLFLKNSHGMEQHFKIFFDILENCDNTSDEILSAFDLFNKDYEKKYIERYEDLYPIQDTLSVGLNINRKIIKLDSIDEIDKIRIDLNDSAFGIRAIVWNGSKLLLYNEDASEIVDVFYENGKWLKTDINYNRDIIITSLSNECLNMIYHGPNEYSLDILEKIGKIYGVNRYFDISFVDDSGITQKKQLKLTNKELYKLILTKIILLNYDGTYSMARELYDKINLPIYIFTESSANVKLILDTGNTSNITQNIQDLFDSNMFTLKSLGIRYNIFKANIAQLALFDSEDENLGWDKGVWV